MTCHRFTCEMSIVSHDRRRHLAHVVDEYFRRAEVTFERSFSSGWNEAASSIEPLYNVFVGANEVILTIDLPYVEPNTVKVRVATDDTLDVAANTSKRISFKDLGMRHRTGEFTCYQARIHIPVPVDEAGIKTKLKRGFLEIRMPRIS